MDMRVPQPSPKDRFFRGAYYNDLMLAPSGLSKLERKMVAVVVSSQNRCYYCLTAHGAVVWHLSGDPVLGEMMVMNYRAADLEPRHRAMLDFTVKLTDTPWLIEEADREKLRQANFSERDMWDIAAIASFQPVEPHGVSRRHAAEPRLPRGGALKSESGAEAKRAASRRPWHSRRKRMARLSEPRRGWGADKSEDRQPGRRGNVAVVAGYWGWRWARVRLNYDGVDEAVNGSAGSRLRHDRPSPIIMKERRARRMD